MQSVEKICSIAVRNLSEIEDKNDTVLSLLSQTVCENLGVISPWLFTHNP